MKIKVVVVDPVTYLVTERCKNITQFNIRKHMKCHSITFLGLESRGPFD